MKGSTKRILTIILCFISTIQLGYFFQNVSTVNEGEEILREEILEGQALMIDNLDGNGVMNSIDYAYLRQYL